MVEIFCKRSELMPSDESVDQHNAKRAEEIADVDKDRNSPEGLFKGTFRITRGVELLYDEADGVLRCPNCQHEDEGGPLCTVCGALFDRGYGDEGHGFSDLDEDADLDLEDLELDADEELEAHGHFHHFLGFPHFPFGAGHAAQLHNHHLHHHYHHDHDSLGESSDSDIDGDSEDDEDEDDEGSLQDFVVRDEEPNHSREANNGPNSRQPITISDDESDEGGAVSNRRRRPHRGRGASSSTPSAPSILTVTTDSENGDNHDEAEMLRDAGWSPLDTENESDTEEPHYRYPGYVSTEDEHNSDNESDTNTMRNEASDDDDDHSRDDLSETPTYRYNGNTYMLDEGTPNSYLTEEDDHSEVEFPHVMDRDGDTEMSASPGPSNTSRGVSVSTGYGYDGEEEIYGCDDQATPRGNRGENVSTGYGDMGESIGAANEIHEVEDDSSDSSIQPPPRRRPKQRHGNPRVQQTDPRISMMFAEHQQSLRGAQNEQGLEGLEDEVRRTEPASRNRRLTAYRLQPPRRIDPLRSSRSPSATRLISSSNRVARPPRQYQRRYHYH